MSTHKLATNALHAGHDVTQNAGTRAVPIYQTTSYVFNDSDHAANLFSLKELGFIYTRLNNPTNQILQDRLSALEGGVGAVAFASGIKTYNGAIGMTVQQEPIETIIERVKRPDFMTGLIATSSITHATPACFYAHVTQRGKEDSIATYMPKSKVDFFAGGGLKFFNKRKDGQDLLPVLSKNGFKVDTTALGKIGTLTTNNKYAYLLADKGLPSKLDGRGDFLPNATKLALDYLSKSKDGFFLMVEGSQIDWGGHQTNVDYIVEEVKDFDKAIGAALDFAMRDGETLVIVTADHETGGFALAPPFGKVKEPFKPEVNGWDYRQIAGSFFENADTMKNRAAHTAAMVPVFAYGPGSEIFSGIYQNNEIFHKMVVQKGE